MLFVRRRRPRGLALVCVGGGRFVCLSRRGGADAVNWLFSGTRQGRRGEPTGINPADFARARNGQIDQVGEAAAAK